MKSTRVAPKASVMVMLVVFIAQFAFAYVPVRISIKFIVDANGKWPGKGHLNTREEINGEVNWGNIILRYVFSELRLELLELVDLPGVSQYYSSSANGENLAWIPTLVF